MNYIVTLDREINFAPETEVEEILQNVRTLMATVIGSVPLAREMGVSWNHVDEPLPLARMRIKQTVIEAIEKYEPRAILQVVEFENNKGDVMEGILKPRVIVSIGNREEKEED